MLFCRDSCDPERVATPNPSPRAPVRTPWAVALAMLGAACVDTNANQVTAPVVLGMTPQLAPVYDDGQMKLYQVQIPVPLPIRKPTDGELKELKPSDPYPRSPYVRSSDMRIELRYTITNLDDTPQTVELILDPWNEFARYKPGIVVGDEVSTPNLSGYDRFFKIEGRARLTGTLTNDDISELAIDLATVQNILAHPPADPMANVSGLINRAFNIQNRSNTNDPLVSPYVPSPIAGLTGFDLGLRTSEPATLAVEILMDVTDLNGNRIVAAGGTEAKIGMPGKTVSPPGARLLN